MANDNYKNDEQNEIFSKIVRAGKRTYFFDVRETKSSDYYLTITESKKHTNEDGSFFYKKHKIYLYKEDFTEFLDTLSETTSYILNQKGEEVISERNQKYFLDESEIKNEISKKDESNSFTNLNFEDI